MMEKVRVGIAHCALTSKKGNDGKGSRAMMGRQQGNDGRKPGLTVQGIWDCTAALEATQGDWKDKHCDDNKDLDNFYNTW